MEYLTNSECESFQTFAIVFSTPENLLVGISGSSRNKRKPLSKQKCILRKWCRVSHKQWMLQPSYLCHCVQHPWKLTCRYFWSSSNKRKPLSKEKFILRKCCGVSHKQWMWELSNLCHCVQHPWKLTCRDFWSSRNKRKPLSKQKGVLKNTVDYLTNSECESFQTLAIVFSTPEILLVGISGSQGMTEFHHLSKNVFWENGVEYLTNSEC